MHKVPSVVLAGGQARRMGGGDKSLLALNGQTILHRVLARLAPQAGDIAVNTNSDPANFAAFDLPIIADSYPGFAGPLAGILAAMEWADSLGSTWVATVAADTPFFPHDLIARLNQAASQKGAKIALAATLDPARGALRQPTFGVWSVDLRDDLRTALGDGIHKVVLWADRHPLARVDFEATPYDPFFNINTAADLVVAQQMFVMGDA